MKRQGETRVVPTHRSNPSAPQVTLEPVEFDRHQSLLARWLRCPHVVRWWGDLGSRFDQLFRTPAGEHTLISVGGRPVGYMRWQSGSTGRTWKRSVCRKSPMVPSISTFRRRLRLARTRCGLCDASPAGAAERGGEGAACRPLRVDRQCRGDEGIRECRFSQIPAIQ
jgi:hypothetical protein